MITNGYTTLSNIKTFLGKNDTTKDTFLEACIERASRYIDQYLSTVFYEKTITSEAIDYHSYSESGFFIVENNLYSPAPIISITSLLEDSVALVVNTDYYLYKTKALKPGGWSTNYKAITFTGKIGYATTPKEIEAVCLELSAVFSGLWTRSFSDGEGNIQDMLKTNLSKATFDFLSMYRAGNV